MYKIEQMTITSGGVFSSIVHTEHGDVRQTVELNGDPKVAAVLVDEETGKKVELPSQIAGIELQSRRVDSGKMEILDDQIDLIIYDPDAEDDENDVRYPLHVTDEETAVFLIHSFGETEHFIDGKFNVPNQ